MNTQIDTISGTVTPFKYDLLYYIMISTTCMKFIIFIGTLTLHLCRIYT